MLQDLIVDLSAFEIVDIIGESTSKKVYLIEEKRTGKYFAAKVHKKGFISNTLIKEFNEKIVAYSKFANHAILPLYGLNYNDFNNEPHPTIITNFMENGSIGYLSKKNFNFQYQRNILFFLALR